jgi:cation transporter-like permease
MAAVCRDTVISERHSYDPDTLVIPSTSPSSLR